MTGFERNLLTSGDTALQPFGLPQAMAPTRHDFPRPGLMHVLWRRRLIVLLVTLLSAGGAFAYVELATPIYMASSRVYVQQSGPKIMSGDDSVARQSTNYLNTECQVIMSGPILAAALDAPGIKALRTFVGDANISPFTQLGKNLKVVPGKNDDLISVSFESPYPEDAAQIVNSVVNAYVEHKSKSKKDTAAEVLKILQKEKVKRDAELEENLKAMLDFKQKHGELGFQGEKGNVIIQRLERLSSALTDAELHLVEAKADYDAVMAIKGDPAKIKKFFEIKRAVGGVYISFQDEDAQFRIQLSALQMRLRSLKQEVRVTRASNPAVQTVEDDIAALKNEIAQREANLADRQVVAVELRYKAAKDTQATIKAAHEQQLTEASGLNRTLADYARLEHNWEQSKKIVEILDSRIKEINITEDVGAMNITVLEAAGKPQTPVKPDIPRVMGVTVGVGLLLGVLLAFLRDRMDPRLTSVAEIVSVLGVPVVGVLPRMKGKKDLVSRGQKVLQTPRSSVAEAYRSVRTALTYGMSGPRAKTVLVTSPAASDGKSTLVSNLAISMALAGQRTLVVDADFRLPRQHEIFQVSNERGLSSVLANGTSLEEVIQRTNIHGLEVLPAGPAPEHPSEMLNSRAFADAINNLGQRYDQVLIDSPPVVSVTDSLILAAVCDVTLVVVRAERSHRRIVEQAREGLFSVGARVFGAVVNAVPYGKSRYGYYAGYYGHGQGRWEKDGDSTAIVKRPVAVPKL